MKIDRSSTAAVVATNVAVIGIALWQHWPLVVLLWPYWLQSVIIGWYSWPSLVSSYEISEYSSDPGGLIRWPIRLLIPIAFALLALQGVSEVIKRIAFLKGLIPYPAEHHKQEPA